MIRLLIALTAATVLAVAGTARADLEPIGDPIETGSFLQVFQVSTLITVPPFDMIAVHVSQGGPLKDPPFGNFLRNVVFLNDWATTYQDGSPLPTTVAAKGPPAVALSWEMHFEGSISQPITFDCVALAGDTVVDSARVMRIKQGPFWKWNVQQGAAYWLPTRSELGDMAVPVPAPAAVLLGVVGLTLVGCWMRRYA